jgi:hypothetical protein
MGRHGHDRQHAPGESVAVSPGGKRLSGEEIIIARNGEPLVRLMPVQKKREQRSKDKVEAGTDFEFAGEEITGFEAPLATDTEKP